MSKTPINIAVLGGSGYTGGELLRLLAQHPFAKITMVTGDKTVGLPVSSRFPNLETLIECQIITHDLGQTLNRILKF